MKTILSHLTEGSDYNILQDIAFGFQKSQILFSAVKLDVFSEIDQGVNTASALADKLSVNQEALVHLLDALVSMSLLRKWSNEYSNTKLASKHLVKSSDEFYGFLPHNADLWNS